MIEPQAELAPDFTLPDMQGREIHLADYRHHRHIVLVLNRGFT